MSGTTREHVDELERPEVAACRELKETPEVIETALKELRQLISDEPTLHCPTDDAFLIKFLRARKCDTQAAFENVKKYFKVRMKHPEMFKDLTPSSVPFDAVCRKHRLITVSRHRDPMGRTVALVRTGAWNTDICTVNDFFRVGLVIAEHLLLQEDFINRGVVLIFDVKGLSLYHLAHYTPSVIRTLVTFMQDCLPVRLKGIYVINNPAVFDLLFGIAKTFLKAKLIKRTRLLGYDVEELHQIMPNDVIPEEHGGTNESYDFDAFEKELESEEEFFQKLGTYGYRDALAETDPECNGLLADEITLSEEYVHF